MTFCGHYSAANAPEVLFHKIENCAKIAILGNNPYTNCHLINNTICLLLTTGLYQRPYEEYDTLALVGQTWITLRALIQEAFQHCFNMTTPTAGHQGYAPANRSSRMHLEFWAKRTMKRTIYPLQIQWQLKLRH
jgi:hypothetical protein